MNMQLVELCSSSSRIRSLWNSAARRVEYAVCGTPTSSSGIHSLWNSAARRVTQFVELSSSSSRIRSLWNTYFIEWNTQFVELCCSYTKITRSSWSVDQVETVNAAICMKSSFEKDGESGQQCALKESRFQSCCGKAATCHLTASLCYQVTSAPPVEVF